MTTNRIEFNAAIAFLVLAALFIVGELIHLSAILAAICGVLSLVAATQGLFAKPTKASAKAKVSDVTTPFKADQGKLEDLIASRFRTYPEAQANAGAARLYAELVAKVRGAKPAHYVRAEDGDEPPLGVGA